MSHRFGTLLALAALILVAPVAEAKRPSVAAAEATTVRAEPDEKGAEVVAVKAGDKLVLLGTRGDWTQVMTSSGKRGWVPSKVVPQEKTGGGTSGVKVASSGTVGASEGSTAVAMRGRPTVKKRTLVVGTGNLDLNVVRRVADLLRGDPHLEIVAVRSETGVKGGSPAGGVDGAAQLGGGDKADVVVGLMGSGGDSLLYEVVDLKRDVVLAKGGTSDATDPRIPVEEVAAAVREAVTPPKAKPADADKTPGAEDPAKDPVKDPAKDAAKDAEATDADAKDGAAKDADPEPAQTRHPNAPLKERFRRK